MVPDDKGLPKVEVLYQLIVPPVPVATKLATVGLEPEQKTCGVLPVGTEGVVLIVTVTSNKEEDSQPLTVCEA